ncbi:thiosulfate sulfurtransferase GlpE [bacterium]|nr:thiosulfate sulfurtransferase GlpE [bacterium]
MSHFERISIHQALTLINDQNCCLIDIRDQQSYQQGHIENAIHLDNSSAAEFIASQPKDTPVIVYCYHGNSSQGGAEFLASQGFSQVYSMDGGFEAWRVDQPSCSS